MNGSTRVDAPVTRTLLLLTLLLPGCSYLRKFNARRDLPPDAKVVDDLDAPRARTSEPTPRAASTTNRRRTQLVGWQDERRDEPRLLEEPRSAPDAAKGVRPVGSPDAEPKRFEWSRLIPGLGKRRAIPLPRTDGGPDPDAVESPSDGFEGI